MQSMETAPKNSPLADYGPRIRLCVDGEVVLGYWCGGLELGEIWIPPGWYADDGKEIETEPSGWEPV
ncbi:hypothetical protein [Phenylobacterium sp.]|uniref:hypothetical protein n=1 Tax=Phenylobacterium sp. TaxID=1871053 RepID=UPI00300369E5